MGDTPLLGNSYLRSRSSQYKCNIAHLRRTRRRQDDLVRRCKYFPSSYTRDTSGKSHESFCRLKANQRFWIGNAVRYGQDNSVFANMDMYRIENVVCYPFRTATLVDNETIEDQIGEGCEEARSGDRHSTRLPHLNWNRWTLFPAAAAGAEDFCGCCS